ncbi:natural resistance-associated macrophage protein [Tothia fuscella]|uniref:Natural resistance-associated macrophage protein n=1 Tax=Tothia fuscella TaxID=1048955 RepID=A0A9P4P0D9_9PEZI|nr:natural resistance-associated macrophage protein [Tothia fuscella]
MNCPIRTDPAPDEGHNQNPSDLASEITTNNSLNHRRNNTNDRQGAIHLEDGSHGSIGEEELHDKDGIRDGLSREKKVVDTGVREVVRVKGGGSAKREFGGGKSWKDGAANGFKKLQQIMMKYFKFMGPGFMVAVAYIDPGNYATDVAAGATFRFRLLFMILLSNIFAIFLQSLCIKLGTVTGMNLAENCKAHLPPWLNYSLYFFAEAAIIATDIAEVIGTAIALNVLLKVPLVAGCAISIVDVLIILFFYNPTGMSMRALRIFEFCVAGLVLGVAVCFCFQLSLIKNVSVGEVFRGYLPSSALVKSKGLYQSCGILGATVMPHSLYLGSGIVQARLKDFDDHHPDNSTTSTPPITHSASNDSATSSTSSEDKYRPSLRAIKSCLTFSIVELGICLFTFALFVNSAILITAGASLSHLSADEIEKADLFSIHDLLSQSLAPAAGTIFALALLLSGTSAGIVCTIAGQMVSEGQLNWTVKPWVRRIITRSISITPSIIIAGAVGRSGLSTALEASQVCLSVILPFVSAPLIWFTCRSSIMSVWAAPETHDDGTVDNVGDGAGVHSEGRLVVMRNHWITACVALVIWGIVVVMNVALLVLVGKGV